MHQIFNIKWTRRKKTKKCLEKETWWMVIKCFRRRKRGDIYLPATASLFIFLIGDVITSWVTERASITHWKRYNGPRHWCLNLLYILIFSTSSKPIWLDWQLRKEDFDIVEIGNAVPLPRFTKSICWDWCPTHYKSHMFLCGRNSTH